MHAVRNGEKERETHTERERVRWRAKEYINFKMYNSDSIDWVNYVIHSHSFLSYSIVHTLALTHSAHKSYTWFYSSFICYNFFCLTVDLIFAACCIHADFHLSLFFKAFKPIQPGDNEWYIIYICIYTPASCTAFYVEKNINDSSNNENQNSNPIEIYIVNDLKLATI